MQCLVMICCSARHYAVGGRHFNSQLQTDLGVLSGIVLAVRWPTDFVVYPSARQFTGMRMTRSLTCHDLWTLRRSIIT